MKKINLLTYVLLVVLSSCINGHEHFVAYKNSEQTCIQKSKIWIETNAINPGSYQPIYFGPLEEMSTVESRLGWNRYVRDSKRYYIIHTYYLTDKNNQTQLNYSKFAYDSEYNLKGFCNYISDSSIIKSILLENIDDKEWKSMYGK